MTEKSDRKKIILFSGTSEGRWLSEGLAEAGVRHTVCVATDYGEAVMEENPVVDVRVGRLDVEEMCALFRETDAVVIDATHPYAEEVSANLRKACETVGAEYVRICREKAEMERPSEMPEMDGTGEAVGVSDVQTSSFVRHFSNTQDCATALKSTKGNILLTTGSKDLAVFAADEEVRRRLFARVIPSVESLRLCEKAGLPGKQIIAMQGPFSAALNEAMIRQFDIRVLVTKESGKAGGFDEKVRAVESAGIDLFVIGRPKEDEGLSVDEALSRFAGARTLPQEMHVTIIGCGPGAKRLLSAEARDAIGTSDLLFGVSRLLREYPEKNGFPYYKCEDIAPVLLEKKPRNAAVLFGGDSGFFSGAAAFQNELSEMAKREKIDITIKTLPGISSVSYLAAKSGRPWSEAPILSVHGKSDDEAAFLKLVEAARQNERVFLLVSGAADVRKLASLLLEFDLSDCRLALGYRLSYSDERVVWRSPAECLESLEEGLITVMVMNPQPERRRLMPVKADEEFIRGQVVPMTKELVRHLILIRLNLSSGDVLFDVGSGTGSVAIEAAGLDADLSVYAIERRAEAVTLIRENVKKHRAVNVQIVEGEAPEAFFDLPCPTHIFIGGSGGKLREILDAISDREFAMSDEPTSGEMPTIRSGITVAITAVSLETLAEITEWRKELGVTNWVVEQIAITEGKRAGGHHLMRAQNPIWLVTMRL